MQFSNDIGILPHCGKCNKVANTNKLEIQWQGKNASVHPITCHEGPEGE